jgi:hypothetical protein
MQRTPDHYNLNRTSLPLHTAFYSMKVDQSMITGESEPVESVVNAADPNALEARNIIFNGSLGKDKPLGKNIPLHPNSYNDTNTPFLSNLLYQWLTVDVWL